MIIQEDSVKPAQVERQILVVVEATLVPTIVPLESFPIRVSVKRVLMGDSRLLQLILANFVLRAKVP